MSLSLTTVFPFSLSSVIYHICYFSFTSLPNLLYRLVFSTNVNFSALRTPGSFSHRINFTVHIILIYSIQPTIKPPFCPKEVQKRRKLPETTNQQVEHWMGPESAAVQTVLPATQQVLHWFLQLLSHACLTSFGGYSKCSSCLGVWSLRHVLLWFWSVWQQLRIY